MILAGRRPQPSHFSAPRPRTVGFDQTRFGMLAAVLQRAHTDLFRGAEVFLNVPGGMRALDGGRGDPVRNKNEPFSVPVAFFLIICQARLGTHARRGKRLKI
jgi:hypothetical protein